MIQHQQVIADRVIAVDIAAREKPCGVRYSRTLLVENAIAQFLRLTHLGCRLRQPDFQRTETTAALRRPVSARRPRLETTICLNGRDDAGKARPRVRWARTLEQAAPGLYA